MSQSNCVRIREVPTFSTFIPFENPSNCRALMLWILVKCLNESAKMNALSTLLFTSAQFDTATNSISGKSFLQCLQTYSQPFRDSRKFVAIVDKPHCLHQNLRSIVSIAPLQIVGSRSSSSTNLITVGSQNLNCLCKAHIVNIERVFIHFKIVHNHSSLDIQSRKFCNASLHTSASIFAPHSLLLS